MTSTRRPSLDDLDDALVEARRAMLAASLDIDEAGWVMPYSFNVQPVAWDLAHCGWFAEFWVLRGPHRHGADGFVHGAAGPRWLGPDEHYDSARVRHPDRWTMPLMSKAQLQANLQEQLAACRARLREDPSPDTRYFAWLAAMHELMHVEARAWTRAFGGEPAPPDVAMPKLGAQAEVAVDAGEHVVGTDFPDELAFDNEHPPARVYVDAFAIDARPVDNGAFAAFVRDGGYERDEWWPGEAGRWLQRADRRLPERWRRAGGGGFEHRHYDRWLPLPDDEAVVHVNAYEAEAWCRWAGRRLPTAAEWEVASDRTSWGRTVWEWTADAFAPRHDFRPGPYLTYSAPWFHHQRELRGGAYTTHPLMHDPRYRNFFLPWRTDVFAGFRSARTA